MGRDTAWSFWSWKRCGSVILLLIASDRLRVAFELDVLAYMACLCAQCLYNCPLALTSLHLVEFNLLPTNASVYSVYRSSMPSLSCLNWLVFLRAGRACSK